MKRYYRLCHRCSHINSRESEIGQCESCQKHFIKYYFCDDLNQFLKSDLENVIHIEPKKSKPIIGISFVWRDDSA